MPRVSDGTAYPPVVDYLELLKEAESVKHAPVQQFVRVPKSKKIKGVGRPGHGLATTW